MTHAKLRRRWQGLLGDYYDSELSTREWCEKNGVTGHQLRYWRTKIGKTQPGSSWACVELVDDIRDTPTPVSDQLGTDASVVSIRIGAASIELRAGFDSAFVCEVLRVVKSTC